MSPPTGSTRPEPHVCDYVEPDGTTAGVCHLLPPHGGRCPTCVDVIGVAGPAGPGDLTVTVHATAATCVHQPAWETQLLCPYPADCEAHR